MKLNYAALLLLLSFNASAAELEAETRQFCEKIKTCALAQIQGEEIPPEMEEMLVPMIDSMCKEMISSVDEMRGDKALEADAAACMNSMSALSCDAIMSGEAETKACMALEKKAEQYEK